MPEKNDLPRSKAQGEKPLKTRGRLRGARLWPSAEASGGGASDVR